MENKKIRSKYNWEALKDEFFASEHIDVASFIRERLGKDTGSNTHIANKTKGWGDDKKAYQQEITDKAKEKAKQKLIEKLKVKLEDVLAGKRLSYDLMISFLEGFAKILNNKELTKEEKKFMAVFPPKSIDMITKWMQIELGEPTKLSELELGETVKKVKIEIVMPGEKVKKDEGDNSS